MWTVTRWWWPAGRVTGSRSPSTDLPGSPGSSSPPWKAAPRPRRSPSTAPRCVDQGQTRDISDTPMARLPLINAAGRGGGGGGGGGGGRGGSALDGAGEEALGEVPLHERSHDDDRDQGERDDRHLDRQRRGYLMPE